MVKVGLGTLFITPDERRRRLNPAPVPVPDPAPVSALVPDPVPEATPTLDPCAHEPPPKLPPLVEPPPPQTTNKQLQFAEETVSWHNGSVGQGLLSDPWRPSTFCEDTENPQRGLVIVCRGPETSKRGMKRLNH